MDIAIARPEVLVEEQRRAPRRWDIFLQLNFLIPTIVLLVMVVSRPSSRPRSHPTIHCKRR